MTPVGNTIIPQNPNQGINTLSGILGIQQQQQNLQTGAYQQQTAQAESQQAQQKNQELAKVGALTQGAYTSGKYSKPDGTFDNAKFANDVSIVAPTYGQQIANDATLRAGEIYKNQQTYFNLEKSKQDVIGDTIGALAGKADVNPFDVSHALEGIRRRFPEDHDLSDMLQSVGGAVPPTAQGPQLQGLLNTMAASLKGTPAVASATNAAGQLINRAPYSGQLSPSGTTPTAGAPAKGPALNPSSAAVAAATTTGTGTAADDNARNQQISNSVAPSRGAITLADQVSNLADQVHTGKFSKEVTDLAATLGQNDPTIAARQLISKYAAQLRTVASTNAPTDNARDQIYAGFPDPEHMSPEAIKGASEYIKGSMLMNLSRAANARQFTQTHGSTQGLRVADDQFSQNADPLMYTYQNLPKGQQRQDFIRRHFANAQDAQNFVQRKNAVEHYGGFNQ
jgi:hypothetical protein